MRSGATQGPVDAHFLFQLSYRLSQLAPTAKVITRTVQDCGMFLANSGNIILTAQNGAEPKTEYGDMGFGLRSLYDLKVTDFEVVDMGTPIRLTDDCVLKP